MRKILKKILSPFIEIDKWFSNLNDYRKAFVVSLCVLGVLILIAAANPTNFQNGILAKSIYLWTSENLTISSDTITPGSSPNSNYKLIPEGLAGTDDLSTVDTSNLPSAGDFVMYVQSSSTDSVITIKNSVNNIITGSGNDIDLENGMILQMVYNQSDGNFYVSGAPGGVSITGTDNQIVRMNGVDAIQNSTPTIDDNGSIDIPATGAYKINTSTVVDSDQLGDNIIYSLLQKVGIITDGTWNATPIEHEYGGLETDVSAYDGLVKITGGATSFVAAPDGAVVGDTDAQTLTQKTIDADNNTISNIDNNEIKAAAGIDATKIADGTVTDTEFQFVDATSSIQTQIDSKQDTVLNLTERIVGNNYRTSQIGSGDSYKPYIGFYSTSGTWSFNDSTIDAISSSFISGYPASDLTDKIGGNTLTNNNSVSFIAGKNGNAFLFAGNNYLNCNDADFAPGTGDFMVSLWVWWASASGYDCVVSLGTSWILRASAGGGQWDAYNGSNNYGGTITTSAWSHAVLIKHNNTMRLYINNSDVLSGGVADSNNYTATNFQIGWSHSSFYINNNSLIDEVYYWDNMGFADWAAAESVIAELYNSGTGKFISETSTSEIKFSNEIKVDIIAESTTDSGVQIEASTLTDSDIDLAYGGIYKINGSSIVDSDMVDVLSNYKISGSTVVDSDQLGPGVIYSSLTKTGNLTIGGIDCDGGYAITNIDNDEIKTGAAIDASKLADGSVSNTEFQYINSLTSNAQDQLDNLTSSTSWLNLATPPTYTSADTRVYYVTFSSLDLSTTVDTGCRIRTTQYSQPTNYTYSIIVRNYYTGSDTIWALYCGSDTADSIGNSTIDTIDYSRVKYPQGFPSDPDRWTEKTEYAISVNYPTPTASTWYSDADLTLAVPIGRWYLDYNCVIQFEDASDDLFGVECTLSDGPGTESDNAFTSRFLGKSTNMSMSVTIIPTLIEIENSDTYWLNTLATEANTDDIYVRGDMRKTILRARCAYY